MGKKNRVIVRIGGREYPVRGSVSEEYIHRVAIYVDKKMEEISERQPPLSTSMLAVLTAINLADEVLKQKDEIMRLQKELNQAKATVKAVAESDRTNLYDLSKKAGR